MSYKIELDPMALDELESAYQWYEERQKDLGLRFVSMMDKRLKEIAVAPSGMPKQTNISAKPGQKFSHTSLFTK